MQCPCGFAADFQQCCAAYIKGKKAPKTAEKLMRSRYSAYATGEMAYIEATCAGAAHASFDTARAMRSAQQTQWVGLEILSTKQGLADDDIGWVEFVARYRDDAGLHELHELSEFHRIDGHWFYVDGKHFDRPAPKIGRNDPCPCKSGKKYKKCCGS